MTNNSMRLYSTVLNPRSVSGTCPMDKGNNSTHMHFLATFFSPWLSPGACELLAHLYWLLSVLSFHPLLPFCSTVWNPEFIALVVTVGCSFRGHLRLPTGLTLSRPSLFPALWQDWCAAYTAVIRSVAKPLPTCHFTSRQIRFILLFHLKSVPLALQHYEKYEYRCERTLILLNLRLVAAHHCVSLWPGSLLLLFSSRPLCPWCMSLWTQRSMTQVSLPNPPLFFPPRALALHQVRV